MMTLSLNLAPEILEMMKRISPNRGEDVLQYLAEDHWKEHLPKRYVELRDSGKLKEALLRAARETREAMAELMLTGMSETSAWDAVCQDWVYLEVEEETLEGEDPQEAETLQLILDGMNLQARWVSERWTASEEEDSQGLIVLS